MYSMTFAEYYNLICGHTLPTIESVVPTVKNTVPTLETVHPSYFAKEKRETGWPYYGSAQAMHEEGPYSPPQGWR